MFFLKSVISLGGACLLQSSLYFLIRSHVVDYDKHKKVVMKNKLSYHSAFLGVLLLSSCSKHGLTDAKLGMGCCGSKPPDVLVATTSSQGPSDQPETLTPVRTDPTGVSPMMPSILPSSSSGDLPEAEHTRNSEAPLEKVENNNNTPTDEPQNIELSVPTDSTRSLSTTTSISPRTPSAQVNERRAAAHTDNPESNADTNGTHSTEEE